jgi:hypothetical protein
LELQQLQRLRKRLSTSPSSSPTTPRVGDERQHSAPPSEVIKHGLYAPLYDEASIETSENEGWESRSGLHEALADLERGEGHDTGGSTARIRRRSLSDLLQLGLTDIELDLEPEASHHGKGDREAKKAKEEVKGVGGLQTVGSLLAGAERELAKEQTKGKEQEGKGRTKKQLGFAAALEASVAALRSEHRHQEDAVAAARARADAAVKEEKAARRRCRRAEKEADALLQQGQIDDLLRYNNEAQRRHMLERERVEHERFRTGKEVGYYTPPQAKFGRANSRTQAFDTNGETGHFGHW